MKMTVKPSATSIRSPNQNSETTDMGRGGKKTERTESERRCIVTGETGPKSGLIRFVVGPDGTIVPDVVGKLPGRGIYVTADRATLEKAALGKYFARAARQKVNVSEDMISSIEAIILSRVINLIALTRKAGKAVAGYEKVKGWLETEQAAILLQASDGSERGKSKLRPPSGPETLISALTGAELGNAFGRENVIHCALAGGGLTTRVVEEAARLVGLRVPSGDNASPMKDRTA